MEIYSINRDHASLLNLAWSVSGHTMDTDLDMGGYDVTNINDLLLNSLGVINFDSGDVTLTHSANLLTLAGGDFAVGGIVQAADFAKTGWPTTPGVILSFVGGTTRTFTVTDGGSAYYYIDGVKYTLGENKTVVIDDLEGLWYIYFDGDTLTASQTIWSFKDEDKALVSFLYWARDVGTPANGKAIIVGWELHSFHMSGATHARLHYAGGTRWETGLLVSDTGENINVSAGDIWDEDLNIPITDDDTPTALFEQVLSPAELPVYYRDGASAWRIYETNEKANATDAGYVDGSNDLKYNKLNGTWANTTVGLNNYVAYYVIATNEQTEPVALIMGQRVDNKLSDAKINNIFAGLSLTGLPFEEMAVLARLILKDTATYTLEEVLDLRAYNIKGNITSPLITQHAGLGGLAWSEAGHTIDTDVDFEGYDLLQVTDIGTTGDADLIQLASGAVTINGTLGVGATTFGGDVDFQSTYDIQNCVDAEFEGKITGSLTNTLDLTSSGTQSFTVQEVTIFGQVYPNIVPVNSAGDEVIIMTGGLFLQEQAGSGGNNVQLLFMAEGAAPGYGEVTYDITNDRLDFLNCAGGYLFDNAIYFTQTDGAEKIDSAADGTLDLYAGTSIDLHGDLKTTDDITDGTYSNTVSQLATASINFVIDGGGVAITAEDHGAVRIPFACTLVRVTLGADISTTTEVDLWKDTHTNFPPTVADSMITGNAAAGVEPIISAGVKAEETSFTNWDTVSFAEGDWLIFDIMQNDNATQLTIELKVIKDNA